MSFAPNNFLSNIKGKGGPAKSNRFEVVIPIPGALAGTVSNSLIEKILNLPQSAFSDISDAINSAIGIDEGKQKSANPAVSRYLTLQCETAELPGKTLQTADVKIYGPIFKVPYNVQYTDMNLTFICTNDFYERKLFDQWMEAIAPNDTYNMRFPKGNSPFTGYMTKVTVIQYDDSVKQIYAVNLIDAFPIGVAAQPLSWSEEGFHRVTIQLAYQKYETVYDGKTDIGNAISALAGQFAGRLLPF